MVVIVFFQQGMGVHELVIHVGFCQSDMCSQERDSILSILYRFV